jgi:hypothetical protein|tara:strand:+ start:141 stop:434 length:294 start_codon:yes stop_codon:yes gene_type:complete
MNLDEYIAKEIGLKSWQLSEHFIFEKNKVKQNEAIKFNNDQIIFLFSLSKSFRLNFEEKDSLKIYNFFVKKNIIKDGDLNRFMASPDDKKEAWNKRF